MSAEKLSYGWMALLFALANSVAWGQNSGTLARIPQTEGAGNTPVRTVSLSRQANQPKESIAAYALVQGHLITEDKAAIEAFYLDVYQIQPNGRRSLFRTGRQVGNAYQVHLQRGYDYELVVQVFGYDERVLRLSATTLENKYQPLTTAVGLKRRGQAAVSTLPATLKEIPVARQATAPEPAALDGASDLKPTPRAGRVKAACSLRYSLTKPDKKMLELPAGALLRVLEYTTKDWWMVSYNGKIGWAPAARVE